MLQFVIYVATLTFQLCGSIMLLVSSFGKISIKVVNDCFSGSSQTLILQNNVIMLREDEVKQSVCNVYLNRMSFMAILAGYLLSVFNSYTVEKPLEMFFIVALVTGALFIILYIIARVLAKKNWKRYAKVNIDSLLPRTEIVIEY